MKTRIVRIGNSQGVRLPRPLLEQAGLGEDVVLRATPGRIVIEAARAPRAGWADAAKAMHAAGDDALLDATSETHFDRDEWAWR
jgi:antitoxin MazE